MERARRDVLRTGAAAGLAAVGLTGNVAGAALFGDAAPYVGFLDLARTTLPGVALGAAAVLVALLGRGPVVSLVLGGGSVAAAAPAFALGLEQRSAGWVTVGALGQLLAPAVVVVALLFPDGRLDGVPRRFAATLVTLVGIGAAVTQSLTYDPGGWDWCRCVTNPVAVLDLGPGDYPRLAHGLLVVHLVVAAVGVLVLATRRAWGRRGVPAGFAATFAVLTICWFLGDVHGLRSADSAPAAIGALRDAALVLLPALYAAGYAAQRPSRARVADLLLTAREEHDPERLETLVRRAIGDPRATVAWWDSERADFRDHDGRRVDEPDRGVLRVEAEGRPIVLVVAERLDSVDSGVRDSLAQALILAAENRRLTAELRASLEQVRDSRARIVAAEDETRRRIERDLHDGAQQLLISTGIKLNLATAQAAPDTALAGALHAASAELTQALSELRSLASGIAPTSLVHGSLGNALGELALRCAVPTTVVVSGVGEPDEQAASTIYFVVAECLANVAKHSGAAQAEVEVQLGDLVRVSVSDDGRGGATLVGRGTGLRGLVDRVEARGGRLELATGSSGTRVTALVPGEGADR